MRAGWVCALLVLSWPAGAQTAAPISPGDMPAKAPPADPLDSPAQAAAKQLPRQLLSAGPQRFSEADKTRVDTVTRLDEIIIYGQVEPEDYVAPRKAPFVQFRERLEKDRPMTPKEKAQLALCVIGLCSVIPREPSLEERNKARTNRSTTQLNSQFRGTLQ